MRITEWLVVAAIFAGGLAYLAYSEASYAKLKEPEGFTSVADFYDRFGQAAHATKLNVNGEVYYELRGPLPPNWSIALPSARPAYIFDAQGGFVDWRSDPGDSPCWRGRWPLNDAKPVDVAEMQRQFRFNQ